MIVIIAVVVQHGDPSISLSKLQELAKGGPTTAAGAILACPLVLAVLWVTIRIARRRFAEYLALNLPSRAELLRGLGISLAFLLAWDLLSYLTGQAPPAFVIDSYRTARDAGLLWLLLVGFCIAAPITEEFTVRGFLFRGWSQSFLGPIGAIVADHRRSGRSVHFQYDWYFVGEVFCVGLDLRLPAIPQPFDLADRGDPCLLQPRGHGSDGADCGCTSYETSAIAIGIVTAARMVCSVMICANSGASPPICRAST